MKSISSVLKRRKKTRNIFLTKKQAYILHSIHRKGRGNNLCLPKISAATTVIATSTTEQEQYDNDPAGIIAIAAAASVSTSIVSAQTHQTDDPENTITGVIPKRLFPLPQPQLLLHPHLSSPHPQFVAAKSLIVNPPGFVYTSYYAVKALCVTYNYLRRETIFIST